MVIVQKEPKLRIPCCNNSWLERRNTVTSGFAEKNSDKTKTLAFHVTAKDNTKRVQPITYDVKHGLTRKSTADEIHQMRYPSHSLSLGLQGKHDLTFHTISQRFKARLKMLVFETCANVIVL